VAKKLTGAAQRLKRWREDPVSFAVEELGVEELDEFQLETLRAFPHNQRIAMKASKGPGKTMTLAVCAWNFLATRPHPKIAATSITADNLSDNLWAEMSKWQSRSQYLKEQFTWTKTRIFAKDHPETWFMSARTWSKTADPQQQADTLAGLHADYLLFLIDEAGGVPDAVAAAAEGGLATGIETKFMIAGNPTMLSGPLYRACHKERRLWFVVTINGDPDSPTRAKRVSVQWARDQIEKFGRENPWVKVNVFGEFPPGSLNALMTMDEVQAAMKRVIRPELYSFSQKRMGVDVARFGDDRSVLFFRQGKNAKEPPMIYRNANTTELAGYVTHAKRKWGTESEFVDDTGGWGAGVIDQLILAKHAPIPVNFSGKASDPRYVNRRAEMYFNAAEWIRNGGALWESTDLLEELTQIQYMFVGGKFQIEDKQQLKDRIGVSPDLSDAFVETFAHPEMPMSGYTGVTESGIIILPSSNRVQMDFDPFRDEALQ
jgi:hypothetical protein